MEKQQRSVVAVVKSDRRRAGIAQALNLIGDQVRSVARPSVVLKPNLVSHQRQLPSTHADAFSATLDALFAAGAEEVTVAEGASDAAAGFERFGLRREAYGRPVRFFDVNRDEKEWSWVDLCRFDGMPTPARVSRTIREAECRVSLALMKTHVTSMFTCSIKNMLSSIHPSDRPLMHGNPAGGNGFSGWRKLVVEFLKGDSLLVNLLTRGMGRARNLRNGLKGLSREDGLARLSAADRRFLESVETLNRNLATLALHVAPHLSVVDGFEAMHREGPRHGTRIRLGVAVAGTDPVAVDSVAAYLMGLDPREIGYLRQAHVLGLGEIDLERIEVVGDPIERVRARCVPHSNAAVARFASGAARESAIPRPHINAQHNLSHR